MWSSGRWSPHSVCNVPSRYILWGCTLIRDSDTILTITHLIPGDEFLGYCILCETADRALSCFKRDYEKRHERRAATDDVLLYKLVFSVAGWAFFTGGRRGVLPLLHKMIDPYGLFDYGDWHLNDSCPIWLIDSDTKDVFVRAEWFDCSEVVSGTGATVVVARRKGCTHTGSHSEGDVITPNREDDGLNLFETRCSECYGEEPLRVILLNEDCSVCPRLLEGPSDREGGVAVLEEKAPAEECDYAGGLASAVASEEDGLLQRCRIEGCGVE